MGALCENASHGMKQQNTCERCKRVEEWPLWLVKCSVCRRLLCSRCAFAYGSGYICFGCRMWSEVTE